MAFQSVVKDEEYPIILRKEAVAQIGLIAPRHGLASSAIDRLIDLSSLKNEELQGEAFRALVLIVESRGIRNPVVFSDADLVKLNALQAQSPVQKHRELVQKAIRSSQENKEKAPRK